MTQLDTIKIRESGGPMTAQEAQEWTAAQMPYENRASDKHTADRVVKYVNEMVSIFDGAARPMFLRWRILDLLMSGNAIEKHQVDTHIPELYKSRETAVPRIESAFFDMQPWFRARPRKPGDDIKAKAEANAKFIEWQLDQARFRNLVPPLIEDLWTYQVCAAKTMWERKYLERVQRDIETSIKGNEVETRIRRKKVEEVIYDGPFVRQINPYWFLIDPRATNVRDATFVGDKTEWAMHDLERFQELGLFQNVDKLKSNEEENIPLASDQGMADFLRYAQTPTARYQAMLQKTSNKATRKIKLTEVWCRFDLYDDGVERECVLTIADGRVCLRAMENPFDKKIRPYAVARAARSGHGFFGIGPMDNAVRLQIDYDRYSSLVMRIVKLIANPITFVEQDADLPNSLHLLPEGAILKGVGNVTMTRMPNTLEMVQFIFGHYERQIAEVTGVPKLLEGSPTGGTATEVMRLTQEGNRRIQGLERRFGEFLQDLLHIIQQLNVQFTTTKTSFPVLGKPSRLLGEFAEIGPSTLLEDVDYEIVGMNNLQSFGTKAMALQQGLVTMMPLIQVNAQSVDTMLWMREYLSATVGDDLAERLVKVPRPVTDFMTQEEENILLMQGQRVGVDPEDDDQDHLNKLVPLLRNLGKFEELQRSCVKTHERAHMIQLERKKQQEKILKNRQAAQQASMPQQAGGEVGEDGGSSPVVGGPKTLPGQTPGQNPGPADASKVGRAGRDSPSMQMQDSDNDGE